MTSFQRHWPILAFSLVMAIAPAVKADAKLPNIVIIYADDLGYGDIGPFGAKGYQTPNLDRLAREGTKFTNFHVSQAVCSASRTALLTGCYSNRLGIHGALGTNSKVGISANEVTLAELLKTKGYATGIAGKWHLGHLPPFLPTRHGLDEYYGLPYSNDMWPNNSAAKKGSYPPLPMIEGSEVIDPEITAEEQTRLTTDYTTRAVKFIEKNKDRPFFFYLPQSMCHVPLYVSEKFRGHSPRGIFGDVIEDLDWSVGEVMKALRDNHLEENTLIIFSSDNGPWLNYGEHAGNAGPLREGKGTSWEGGVRVPCVMRWPGKIPACATSNAMLMTIDLFPTIAKIVGAELPKQKIDGLDVAPLLMGQPGAKNPHEAYYVYYEVDQLQAVISGDGHWKLVLPHTYRSLKGRPGGKNGDPVRYDLVKLADAELYDLEGDVGETTNVAKAHPEIVKQLLDQAEKAREDLGDALTKRKGSGLRAPGRVGPEPKPGA